MSETALKTIIPKFKDKVMYYKDGNLENSYVVASSFRGILRLSPNDSATTYEKKIGELGPTEEVVDKNGVVINYTDAIVPDIEGMLGKADITNRYIRVSDSDGQMIGLRFGDFSPENGCTGVEFDTLNVIGKLRADKNITLYTEAKTYLDDSFMLNGTSMPIMANSLKSDFKEDLWEYDANDIHISLNTDGSFGDDSCFLYGVGEGVRRFKYGSVRDLVNTYVMEALMSLKTVPTGSVHFVPITIKQYQALEAKGDHNRYIHKDGGNVYDSDPIVRDYLLCDGRAYYTNDFPELAKVLYGEKIQYWREDNGKQYLYTQYNGRNVSASSSGDVVDCYGSDNLDVYKLENDYASDEIRVRNLKPLDQKQTPYTFRVPDLRGMFIKSVPVTTHDNHSVKSEKDYNHAELTETGTFMPDNMPFYRALEATAKNDRDEHFHMTHFGSYDDQLKLALIEGGLTNVYLSPVKPLDNEKADYYGVRFAKVYKSTDDAPIGEDEVTSKYLNELSEGSFSLPLLNSANKVCWNYGYKGPATIRCRCDYSYSGYVSHPYYFFFTVDSNASYLKKGAVVPSKGCTSYNIPSLSYKLEESDTYKKIYFDGDIRYNKSEEYSDNHIISDTINETSTMFVGPLHYGRENAPTHIICVPLIKI